MTPLSNEILEKYQVRKTSKQKLAFIKLLQEHFPQLIVEESGFPKSRNLIVGDLDHAKVVLTAHYDTCARSPLPNFILPKNPVLSLLYGLLMAAPGFLLGFIAIFLLQSLDLDSISNYYTVLGFYLLYTNLLVIGPANRHTANDNTSGVITLCELLTTLTDDQRSKIAFVFFDNEESGLLGSSQFRARHKKLMENKLLINFDCVSDGDHILLSANKNARNQYGDLLKQCFTPTKDLSVLFSNAEKVLYPSDQLGFQTTVAVAALKRSKVFGFYMDRIHTEKDTVFKKRNITYLCNGILQLVKQL